MTVKPRRASSAVTFSVFIEAAAPPKSACPSSDSPADATSATTAGRRQPSTSCSAGTLR